MKSARSFAKLLIVTIVLLLVVGSVYVPAASLTNVNIEVNGNIEFVKGNSSSNVSVKKNGSFIQQNVDLASRNFVLTSNGNQVNYSITIASDLNGRTLNIELNNLVMESAAAWKNNGTANVNLTLTGDNELYSGSNAVGLEIPTGATYYISGNGLLKVKGKFAVGDTDADKAGSLRTISGTILAAEDDPSNVSVIYEGGSVKLPLWDNCYVSDYLGRMLAPMKSNLFGSLSGLSNHQISVDGQSVRLGADNMAYLYVRPAVDTLLTDPYTVSTNDSVLFKGIYGSFYANRVHGIQWYKGNSSSIDSGSIKTIDLTKNEFDYLLTGLEKDTEYTYRVWADNDASQTAYSSWLTVKTKSDEDVVPVETEIVDFDQSTKVVQLTSEKRESAVLVYVQYNENGTMKTFLSKSVTLAEGDNSVTWSQLPTTHGYAAKILLFKSIDTVRPLCAGYDIQ